MRNEMKNKSKLTSFVTVLGGGWTYQLNIFGGVFQLKYCHPTFASNGEAPAMTLFHEIDSGYALASGLYLSDEAGNKGNDLLSGGTGNDNQVGEDGHDILLGCLCRDLLKDRDGGDLEWRMAA